MCTLWQRYDLLYPVADGNIHTTKAKEENTMTTKFYLDGKKITRKAVKELIGEERLKRILEEAKETFLEDPLVQNDFFIGSGMLTVEFA